MINGHRAARITGGGDSPKTASSPQQGGDKGADQRGGGPRTKDHGAGVAKGMLGAARTVEDLDRLIEGDARKSIIGLHTEKRKELAAAAAQAELGGEPPHDPQTGEVLGDGPPPPTDDDVPF